MIVRALVAVVLSAAALVAQTRTTLDVYVVDVEGGNAVREGLLDQGRGTRRRDVYSDERAERFQQDVLMGGKGK